MSKENPPVFPITHNGSTLPGSAGLTMRDYFAAKAMQGFAASPGGWCSEDVANLAYRWADAMMKAKGEQ